MITIVKNFYQRRAGTGAVDISAEGRANLGNNAPNLPSTGTQGRRAADSGIDTPAIAWLDPFERDVLEIARYFFEAFSDPASHAWVEAFRKAETVFPMPFGASIAHAILIAINALRVSRRQTFQFERPSSLSGSACLTDAERYFMRILYDIRRQDRVSARAHALFLCEGNDASEVLAAFERLAIITGDVGDPHFNRPA